MKLVILAAAIIIAKTISDPTYMDTHKVHVILVVAAFGLWEAYDYYKQNKKQ